MMRILKRAVRILLVLIFLVLPITYLVLGNLMVEEYVPEPRPHDLPGIHSFFKTPQTAVITAGRLVADQNWEKLAQFYDLSKSDLERDELESGSWFQTVPLGQAHTPPFEADYVFSEILGTEFDDVFEVVVMKPYEEASTGTVPDEGLDIQFFYLKRYPEGYQLLPGRPADRPSDQFQ